MTYCTVVRSWKRDYMYSTESKRVTARIEVLYLGNFGTFWIVLGTYRSDSVFFVFFTKITLNEALEVPQQNEIGS